MALRAQLRFLLSASSLILRVDIDSSKPEEVIIIALAVRTLRLAFATYELAVRGYTQEAEPLLRATLSAVVGLKYIVKDETPARALAYATHLHDLRQKRSADKRQSGAPISETEHRLDSQAAELDDLLRKQFAERGIEPKKIGQRKDTWTGVSDRALFEYVGKPEWYFADYVSLSDAIHVNVSALLGDVGSLLSGRDPIGPRLDHPFALFVSSSALVTEMLIDVDDFLNLGKAKRIDHLRKQLTRPLLTAYEAGRAQHAPTPP